MYVCSMMFYVTVCVCALRTLCLCPSLCLSIYYYYYIIIIINYSPSMTTQASYRMNVLGPFFSTWNFFFPHFIGGKMPIFSANPTFFLKNMASCWIVYFIWLVPVNELLENNITQIKEVYHRCGTWVLFLSFKVFFWWFKDSFMVLWYNTLWFFFVFFIFFHLYIYCRCSFQGECATSKSRTDNVLVMSRSMKKRVKLDYKRHWAMKWLKFYMNCTDTCKCKYNKKYQCPSWLYCN